MLSDMELLQEYASRNTEQAFATLVARHVSMVYSVALRHVGNAHQAQEITQAVFIILARKARSLRPGTVLSGWLFQTARLTAANSLRTEIRRTRREQEACMQSTLHENEAEVWKQIAPLLDKAIADLSETDRNAVVLRYLEGKDLKEVGAVLGTSEEAAKKRVSRAMDKLRAFFTRHGIALSGTVLSGVILTNSASAVPAGLAAAVTAAAVKGTVLTTSTLTLVKGTLKIMAWTKLKIAVGVGVAALVAVQWHEIASQKKQLASLQQERPRAEATRTEPVQADSLELDQLRSDTVRLSNEVRQLRGQMASQKLVEEPPVLLVNKLNATSPPEQPLRQLGLAVAQGDPTALGKLEELSKAAHENYNTNGAKLKTEEERHALWTELFPPLQQAFDAMGEEAAKGNANALQALGRATQMDFLQGFAVQSLGEVAGRGNESMLEALLNPDKYGLLLSSTVAALKPAADNGNQKAIEALAAVTTDDHNAPLWFMAAEGLGKAAESGNPVAIDALIRLSGSTNQNVQTAAVNGLKRAAGTQNVKAVDALRQMDRQSPVFR
jgi:RNA polymerase sigma factor (sigma-70 family)